METCYCNLLNNMKNDEKVDKNLLGIRLEQVSRVL